MIKVDLHIHTISTLWDLAFNFDLSQLKAHVKEQRLDCIAITNHNTFDSEQYAFIANELSNDCTVLPGVEVSALGTHLLVIGASNDAEAIQAACVKIRACLKDEEDTCTKEELFEAFPRLEQFIVIPHYKKDPEISDEKLEELQHLITAVETSSLAKAMRIKRAGNITISPVYFTDYRFGSEDPAGKRPKYRPGSIYLRLDSPIFDQIKNELRLGHAQLNALGNDDVEIYPGIAIKKGINLVIGKRSTGKSYTLERARKCFDEEDIFYIKQGDLVDESQEKSFYENLNERFSDSAAKYEEHWTPLLETAFKLGTRTAQIKEISEYLDELKSYAETKTLGDAYSKAALFTRQEIEKPETTEAAKLIKAVMTLLKSEDYSAQIDSILGRANLLALLKVFITDAKLEQTTIKAVQEANKITLAIQDHLSVSATSKYPGHSISSIAAKIAFINRCEDLLEECWKQQIIFDDEGATFTNYSITATREKYANTDELKKRSGISSALGSLGNATPRDYFEKLLGVDESERDLVSSALFNVDIGITDSKGASPSGGQRTECVFLGKLAEAKGKKVILIDEPESSFDNLFLDKDVADKIKELGQHAIVLITTHSPVLGFAVEPDKVIATTYDSDSKEYQVYEGSLKDGNLVSFSGDKENTRSHIRMILEAGKDSFDRRADYYEGAE